MTKNIKSNAIQLEKVEVTSPFWKRYRDLVAEVVIPYQYETLSDENDVEIANDAFTDERFYDEDLKSHAIENLKIAAGLSKSKNHQGMNFQDTDVYKWLEAAAYTLEYFPDKEMQKKTDEIVELIAQAQEEDGYLSTLFQIDMPERKFKRLDQSHELYSMGHYIEAGVAYYEVTGNYTALEIAKKMADHLYDIFGYGDNQIPGYDGHPEIELALMRLWEVTKDDRYLELTNFFIRERGEDPEFFDKQNRIDGIDNAFWPELREFGTRYYFSDKPVTCQHDAHGHAVRCVYFCAGLAHLARITGEKDLQDAAERLWRNITQKQMYITGNIGQTKSGEAFTFDYDLPNDTIYGETCASVAMTFFARQMLAGEFKSEYADVIEKELFNGALSGMSLDGTHYFYVNPLEADPKSSALDPNKKHVLTRRQAWFGTACCPANIARLVASVDRYLYEVKDDVILAHQYIANSTQFSNNIKIEQDSNLPWNGEVTFTISNPEKSPFRFAIRIPNWSKNHFKITVNGTEVKVSAEEGIVYFNIEDAETTIELTLDMQVHIVRANRQVKENINKVALQSGPVVYCAEETDNQSKLFDYQLDVNPDFTVAYHPDLLGGVNVITTRDVTRLQNTVDDLYTFDTKPKGEKSKLTMIPYYAWANRDEGEMTVWLHE